MPIGTAIATAATSAGVKLYEGSKARKVSKKALAQQQANIERVWGKVDPFLTSGVSALGRISDPASVNANFMASPDYNFRKAQSLDAVTTSKAVNSLLRSGSALNAVTQRAGDLASGEFNSWWNKQSGLANMGLQGAQIGAGLASKSNEAIGTNATNLGNSYLSDGNTISSLVGSLGDLLGKYGGSSAASGGPQGSSYSSPVFGGDGPQQVNTPPPVGYDQGYTSLPVVSR